MRQPLDIPPGLNGDDTTYGAEGRWQACSLVRFHNGKAQADGGFESLISTLLTGVCRAAFPWTDNSAILNIGFGTHSALQVWQGGGLFNITPFGPPALLGTDPVTTHNGTARVDVHHVAHGRTTADSVEIANATAVGGITPNGTFPITVDDVDNYHFTFTSNATSSATGGGAAVVETPQVLLPAGSTDGTGSVGFGTGAFGGGPWGETPVTADYFPRTWSLDAWGEELLASPRNGGLYLWSNDTSAKAIAVEGAPVQITYALVAPVDGGYMAVAIGCNQEVDGVFNPRVIRHSSIRNLTQWSTLADSSTAREYTLPGSGRLVAARMCGPYMLVWSADELFLGTFVGALNEPWRFDRVGMHCGLIGPNAAVVVGQSAYWASPDRQFYRYDLGGAAGPIECQIRVEYATNLAAAQADKIVASSNAEFSEVRWDYPDGRDGFENSRFVRLCVSGPDAGAWSQGVQARTAFVDAGPSLYPVGVTYDGHAYYHEKGHSADGAPMAWFIRSAGQVLDPDRRLLVKECWPDFQDQQGPISVTIYSREHPQQEPPTVLTAAPMAPGDAKADFMITGRMFQVEFSGSAAPTDMRIGKPTFEVSSAGRF